MDANYRIAFPSIKPRKVVAMFKRRMRAIYRMTRQRLVAALPTGARLVISSRKLARRHRDEMTLLSTMVERGSLVIDVGANVGKYSYLLSKMVGQGGRVISVEPLRENALIIQKAADELRLPIHVHTCALSSEPGQATIHIPIREGQPVTGLAHLGEARDEHQERQVEVRTLDELVKDYSATISLIKVDVEGHEYDVIQGAAKTLRDHKPNLLVEIEQRHLDRPIHDVFDAIIALGYSGFFLDTAGDPQPLSEFNLAKHQFKHVSHVQHSEYVNDFFFIPIGRSLARGRVT
jgi:FkbM family methyltransferase